MNMERDDVAAWSMDGKQIDCEKIIQYRAWKIARYIVHNGSVEIVQRMATYAAMDSLEDIKMIFEMIEEDKRIDYIDMCVTRHAAETSLGAIMYIFEIIKKSGGSLVDHIDRGIIRCAGIHSPEAMKYLFKILEENGKSPKDYIYSDITLYITQESPESLIYIYAR